MKIKNILLFLVFLSALGSLTYLALEYYSKNQFENRVANSLAIFTGILRDGNDVLNILPNHEIKWVGQEFNVKVRTNDRGFREKFNFVDSSVQVGFLGDSYTFGHGINVSDRYTNVVAGKFTDKTVVSLSYNNGFQPEHYEYYLTQHPKIKPEVMFLAVYLGNDFDSDLNETIIQRNESGEINQIEIPYREIYKNTWVNKTTYTFSWFKSLVDNTYLGKLLAIRVNASPRLRSFFMAQQKVITNSPNRLSTELGEFDSHNLRTIKSLKNIKSIIENRDGQLHVLLIPQNFLVGNVEVPHLSIDNLNSIQEIRKKNGLVKTVLDQCEKKDLNCHDLTPILTADDYFRKDAHWNKKGHLKVGDYVATIVDSVIVQKQLKL